MHADPYFLLCGRGMMEMWEAGLLFWGLGGKAGSELDSLFPS